MEYVYTALLLHSAKKEITEENVRKVLEAAGITPDEGKIKALVTSLEGKNIDEIIKEASTLQAVAPKVEGKEEEEKKKAEEEEKKKAEEAAAGLSALFG